MTYENKKYTKSITSIWNPPSKVTWPQYIAELVIYNRSLFIDKYKTLKKGKDWWVPIGSEVRRLNQQASHILSYFDSPEENLIVNQAIINHIKKRSVCKIGAYRKDKSKATNDEKFIVRSIQTEIKNLEKAKQNVEQAPVINVITETQAPQKEINSRWKKFQT